MGLLDQLWDDTVAGPRPDNGLGKLRKHNTFGYRESSGKELDTGSVRSVDRLRFRQLGLLHRSLRSRGVDSPSGFREGRHRMRTRREDRTDQALLLLSMSEK
ncbi:hypothetical protein K1719_033177 [Acacia pycnantha]|nr:hypothetical protein K1719_033177 [Acacia pycnantha]